MRSLSSLPTGGSLLSVSETGHFYKEMTVLKHVKGSRQLEEPPTSFDAIEKGMALVCSVNKGHALMLIEDKYDLAEAIHPQNTKHKLWIYIPQDKVSKM
jgi:hypothetical protein